MATFPEYQGEASSYLVRNPGAKPIQEGVDFRPLTSDEQQQCRTAESPIQAATPFVDSSEEMVTVRLPPTVLASLLTGSSTNSKVQTTSVPPALQYDPSRPSMTGNTNANPTECMFNPLPVPTGMSETATQSLTSAVSESTRYEPTPILSTSPQLHIPDFPVARSRSHTPLVSNQSAFSPLNTPNFRDRDELPTSVENIMPQLLGGVSPEHMTFSPGPSRPLTNQPEPIKKMVNQESQTEPEAPKIDSLAPLNNVLGHFEKTMETTVGKVAFAVESVARATRHIQQSLDTMGASLFQMSRSLERMMEEQRRYMRRSDQPGQSTKRAREEEDKENDRALKSVVTKKNNNHRR